MKDIYIGKIVNTHGLKGEVRILSSFAYKEKVFKKDFLFYIGKNKEEKKVLCYRKHKQFDMVVLEGIDTIEKAEYYKGQNVYVKRDFLPSDIYLNEDLIGLTAYVGEKEIGKVNDILETKAQRLLVIEKNLIPLVDVFIQQVDLQNGKIFLIDMEGLYHED